MRGGVLMHAYLKTIGFSKIKTTKELQEILRDVVENYDRKKIVETEEHHLFAEFSKEYAYAAWHHDDLLSDACSGIS